MVAAAHFDLPHTPEIQIELDLSAKAQRPQLLAPSSQVPGRCRAHGR
jgi:hypothetical protein